ncbi:HNH endonuclease [Pseudofrankia asymbiotica]|uniref:Uncharacterized protein n=1 Tax=Pseudofrankia asymbiotica TaxID=1834516 RepID=A0A1V2I5I4_9ACTN|nr:DUF222 domain-containing protein [Pseudofrankia asymbiotica]ONH26220.1 hypothetical protein BL253_25120 [Pseudofrankia asymbiotica]
MFLAPAPWLVIAMAVVESEAVSPASVDAEKAPLAELEGEIVAWAGRLAAATCDWLVLLAVFDRRDGWRGQGFASCAHWAAWRCGLAVRTAREHLAVGHALASLPAVRTAFAAGRLSYSKVRAVTRVAEPASEASWLKHALCCTAAQLERLAATCERLTGDHAEQRAGRRVSWRTDRDGMLRLTAVLPADEGAQLVAAIDAARASLDDTNPVPGPDEPDRAPADGEIMAAPRGRRSDADALVAVAAGFLHRPAPGLMSLPHTVTVHVDIETLLGAGPPGTGIGPSDHAGTAGARTHAPEDRGSREAGVPGDADAPEETRRTDAAVGTDESGRPDCTVRARQTDGEAAGQGQPPGPARRGLFRADLEPGVGLTMPVLRRLGCDGMLRALLSDAEGNPLHLGRRRRFPNQRLREAVYARDHGTCQYPGCEHTRWLQCHHLAEWVADEGETDIDLLTLLCTAHHHAVHDEGITLERAVDGALLAILADGRALRPAPPVDAGPRPAETLATVTSHVGEAAIATRHGGRLHLADSMLVLTQHRWNQVGQSQTTVETVPTPSTAGTNENKRCVRPTEASPVRPTPPAAPSFDRHDQRRRVPQPRKSARMRRRRVEDHT